MQDLASFTSHHLAYKVVYLSAESFMTREAVKVSLADCLDVAANEKTLISQLLQLCLDVPKALSILLLFKKSGNSYCSLFMLLSWALRVRLVPGLVWVSICFRDSLLRSCSCRDAEWQAPQTPGCITQIWLNKHLCCFSAVILTVWGFSVLPSWGERIVLCVHVHDEEHRLSIFIRSHFSDRKFK